MISDLSIDFQMAKNGGLKSFSLCLFWRFDNWLLFWQSKTPWGEVIQRKRLFYTFLMRKHDFWPFHWFLNGQKWRVKIASLYVYFEGLTTDSYSAKQDSLGRGHIENGLFYTLLIRKHDFSPFHWFLKGQKWGVKKASFYVYFEGLTTDSYFGKARPCGGRSYRKMAFLHSSDEKAWFLTFPLIFKWSEMGG